MNELDLKQFIFNASRATYASGDSSIKIKEVDNSTTIRFSEGSYAFHDNYFGGEPYGGREVVFFNEKPVWMMVYYGLVHGGENRDVYTFLMESLSHSTLESPYRGPDNYSRDDWTYKNTIIGNVSHFSGTEKIYKDTLCVYEASYIGGYIDR